MSTEKKFSFDSLQDAEGIGTFLEALIEGMRKGHILLSSADDKVEMYPKNLLRFSLKARRKGINNKISLKIEWKDRQEDAAIKTLYVGN